MPSQIELIAANLAPTRRPRRIRTARFPLSLEREYVATARANVRAQFDLYQRLLFPRLAEIARLAGVRRDAFRQDQAAWRLLLREIIQDVGQRYGAIEGIVRDDAEEMARQMNLFNRAEISRQFRNALGVDVFAENPDLVDALEEFADRAVSNIQNTSATINSTVSNVVADGFRAGQRPADVAESIVNVLGVAENRAAFWARDIIGTLSGQLTKQRQEALGVEQYIWRTSRDELVRDSHRALEGTTQSWDEPPTVGQRQVHPGEDYNCRCSADPVIPGVDNIETSPSDVRRDPELVRRRRNRDRRARERTKRRRLGQPPRVAL